jgi:Family of unknown function (DUF5677)
MPTDALETILNRDLSKVAAKDVIDIASPLLREIVNYSTNAFQRCMDSRPGSENEDGALLIIYLHAIEMTDGTEVLIAQSCPTPAIPLVRSLFESLLATEYILENQADYVQRSLSWLVGYVHDRLKIYERLDPSTLSGKDYEKKAADDKRLTLLSVPAPAEVQQAITSLQQLLTEPQLQLIEAEYSSKGNPHWYHLFGGPSNLADLARRLHSGAQYEFLYRYWSSIEHVQDMSRFLERSSSNDPVARAVRDGSQIQDVTVLAMTFMLDMTRSMLGKFRPGENVDSWYQREVRPLFTALRKLP